MGRSHQTIIRMRGPAILALMSLLLLNVGAQPLAGSYPKTLDCKGGVSVNQDDSGTTLTCGDGNTYPLEPCEDGINMNQVDGKTTVTCGGGDGDPVKEHGGWPVQEHGGWPVQELGGWGVQQHHKTWCSWFHMPICWCIDCSRQPPRVTHPGLGWPSCRGTNRDCGR